MMMNLILLDMYQQDIVRMVMMHHLNHLMRMYQVYIALKHIQTRIVTDS